MYQKLITSVSRHVDGSYRLISPTEYESWFRLTGNLVYPVEYDILSAMDREYCIEANKEIHDIRTREAEERERESKRKTRGTFGRKG